MIGTFSSNHPGDNQKKHTFVSSLDISRHQRTLRVLAAGLIGIVMSQFFLLSLAPHTSLSSQTPEWLAPFCFIAHQTGLELSARPLDQGSATSAEAGVDRGCTPHRGTHGRLEQLLRRLEQQASEGPPGGTSQQVERK